jgi:hypothetical protein
MSTAIKTSETRFCEWDLRAQKPSEYETKVQVERQILAGESLLRSGQTQVGKPKVGEHAQYHYFASVTTQTLR